MERAREVGEPVSDPRVLWETHSDGWLTPDGFADHARRGAKRTLMPILSMECGRPGCHGRLRGGPGGPIPTRVSLSDLAAPLRAQGVALAPHASSPARPPAAHQGGHNPLPHSNKLPCFATKFELILGAQIGENWLKTLGPPYEK